MLRIAALFALAAVPALAQNVPTGFVIETLVSSGLVLPNDCCFLRDGRCLVVHAAGDVSVYAGTSTSAAVIGTVPAVESTGGERGLLSIAADPAFASNGHIYVWYASTADAFMHLDRFTCTGALTDATSTNLQFAAASRHVLLGAVPDNAPVHNGGSVRFGPDGRLYLTIGEDADACSAQATTSQLGCLLRLDVSQRPPGGSLVLPAFSALDPGDNPLSANTDFSQLVLAHGLRNPFRMEIDPVTGNLYIGDVGAGAVEEYSEYVRPAGPLVLRNFGWPWREGDQAGTGCGGTPPPGLVEPIAAVPRVQGWASVMGGARYRNLGGVHDFGPAYDGCAFYLDYFVGELRRLVHTGAWGPAPAVAGQPNATNWGTGFLSVTSLRLGPDGALWFTQRPGTLKRLRPTGPPGISIAAQGGGGQRGPAGEPFPQPLVVRVAGPQGNPVANATVDFTIAGPGALSTTNPVFTDANGLAQTSVTALMAGGAITVTASTPGTLVNAAFGLYSRKITAMLFGSFLALGITNETSVVPPQVPFVVMLSFPGSPTLPTLVGPLCIDPGYALAVVIEDGTGMFGFVSFSGTGGVGSPGLGKTYPLPPGLFTGQLMRFQAVGFDPISGWFRTNCEQVQF